MGRHVLIDASTLLLVLRHFCYVGRHVLISASALLLVLRHFYYVGRHVLIGASALLLVLRHFCYVSSSYQCFGTPASATALLLREHARFDQCFGTPASATTLLLHGKAHISSILYHTFGFLVYCVPLIHGSWSR